MEWSGHDGSQNLKIVGKRPTETKRIPRQVCYRAAVEQSGRDKQKRISTHRERAVIRDVLTEKHRPWKLVGTGCIEESGTSFCLVDLFSCVANFGCENSGQCERRLLPPKNPHLMKRVLGIGRTHKPVWSVLKRSLEFDMADSLTCEQRSNCWVEKKCQLLARISIMNP